MEHLSNCHGEWNFLVAALYSLPIVGIYIKSKFKGLSNVE